MEYMYAALLLHKLGKPIDEHHLKKVIEATSVQVDEAKLKSLIASLQGVDIAKELESASIATAPAAIAVKAEEKKEEKAEEAAEGLSALFG